MKQLLIATIILATSFTASADKSYFAKDGSSLKEITKVEALKSLINNPNAAIVQCSDVELSDKATIRNKKQASK